jgi:hypothetical protein
MSVSPSVHVINSVGFRDKECHIPITLLSCKHMKTIATTAIIDTGAAATFISEKFIDKHNIPSHPLSKPFPIRMADGKCPVKHISQYCILGIQVDRRVMIGKFNIMTMLDHNDIILGFPWIFSMKPITDFPNRKITMNQTLRSCRLEVAINKQQL